MRHCPRVSSAHILLVEDETNVAFVASAALRLADYSVTEADCGREGLAIASEQAIDLAILDVMLPDLDGFEICQQLRSAGHDFPIVFLTARDATEDRVRGLTIGGDDYLTKPFSVEELVARVHAILRRVGKQAPGKTYRCGPLSLDDAAHLVTRDGQRVDLSPTEYKLLRFLLRNTGRVAQPRPDPRPRVGLRLRRRDQRRRHLHLHPQEEGRSRRTPPDPHRPRRRLPHDRSLSR